MENNTTMSAPEPNSSYNGGGLHRLPMDFDKTDYSLAIALLGAGFLFWNLIHPVTWGAGITLFAFLLCTLSLIYFHQVGIKQTRRSLICLLILLLSALPFALFDNWGIKFLNFWFTMAIYIYWICLSTDRQLDRSLSSYIIGDGFNQILLVPFNNFTCAPNSLKMVLRHNKNSKRLLSLGLGILIFLPLLIAVINLLISADAAFERFMVNIYNLTRWDSFFNIVWQVLLGIPVAAYLFGLLYGNRRGRYTNKITTTAMDKLTLDLRLAPRLTIYSPLTTFNLVYFIFFVVQATYLFSALSGALPDSFTYAEYARRGFFQLCAVAGINLGLIAFSHLVTKRGAGEEPTALRIQYLITSGFTILLIITAFSKMLMYIQTYGLTPLRVYTSWFMLLLFFIFMVIIVRQLRRFNASRWMIAGFITLFMLLSYGNVDGLIARYNLDRYQNGSLSAVDYSVMLELSDAALPHLYEFYQTIDDTEPEGRTVKAEIRSLIAQHQEYSFYRGNNGSDFRDFNWQSYRAAQISRQIIAPEVSYSASDAR